MLLKSSKIPFDVSLSVDYIEVVNSAVSLKFIIPEIELLAIMRLGSVDTNYVVIEMERKYFSY